MERSNILIALALVALFVTSFLGSGNASLYVNVIGLTIVISGTLAATVLSYPLADIGAALRVAHNSYASSPPSDSRSTFARVPRHQASTPATPSTISPGKLLPSSRRPRPTKKSPSSCS